MDGIINVYKEPGYTSFDVIAVLRGIFKQKKIGHTGTLDPMATGVLPVCLGNATKLCEMLTDHTKVYEAVMLLGVTYDTQDVTGEKLTECDKIPTVIELENAVKQFEGGYDQMPPMYSAKKVDGKKLYDIARAGEIVERKKVHVDIDKVDITYVDFPRVGLRVTCGKGTYIRTFIADIGESLGCGAAMESLVRTQVGDFTIDKAFKISEIEELVASSEIDKYILKPDVVFGECKAITIPQALMRFLDNGNVFEEEMLIKENVISGSSPADGERFRIYDSDGCFKAVYEYHVRDKKYKPYKMFM